MALAAEATLSEANATRREAEHDFDDCNRTRNRQRGDHG